ncbi:MAG: carboxylesterase family protein [Candidatus Lokiarchaeota archaeon]|nr:carboxylesterase family protein [Candidatus Lokiarchaeota archaeon]
MQTTEIIETSVGMVRGYIDGDLKVFKGIPYAERPIGELRFKPPVPRKKWFGVFDALDYSPICVQNADYPGWTLPPTPQSEADSLTLNIWTPGTDNKKRSVMVWFHGGGMSSGSGRLPNGFKLARRGDIVVVSINYRLGALGFSEIKGIESNIGILDQIEALKWIQKNIEFFGGDPDCITIFGFSAGGWSVSILMGIPASKGLFNRVIAQSGAAHPLSFQTKNGMEISKRVLKTLKINEGDIESLRRITANELVEVHTKIANEVEWTTGPWVLVVPPYIDGSTIPEHPLGMIKKGIASDIDLMVGCTLNESIPKIKPNSEKLDMGEVKRRIVKAIKLLGHDDKKGLEMFEVYKDAGDPEAILTAFSTDLDFRISAIRLAEEQSVHTPRTYMYLFTYPLKIQGKEYGAFHGGDVGFIHGSLDNPKMGVEIDNLEEAQPLSEKMMDSWIAFAKTGNPNHEGIEEWSKYDINTRKTMFLGKDTISVDDPMKKQRIAWADIMKI